MKCQCKKMYSESLTNGYKNSCFACHLIVLSLLYAVLSHRRAIRARYFYTLCNKKERLPIRNKEFPEKQQAVQLKKLLVLFRKRNGYGVNRILL